MKKFVIINSINGDTPRLLSSSAYGNYNDAMNDAVVDARKEARERGIKVTTGCHGNLAVNYDCGTVTLDTGMQTLHWAVETVSVELDQLQELFRLLYRHGLVFTFTPVTVSLWHDGEPLTGKVSLLSSDSANVRILSEVFWCPAKGALVDPRDSGSTSDMDAQEVCRWWLNEFKGVEVPYGDC